MIHYENGEEVDVEQFDYPKIYENCDGEKPPEPLDANARIATLEMLISMIRLGQWMGQDKVREYAVDVILRKANQNVKHFASEHGVSENLVRRRIREARSLTGLPACNADE